MLDASTLSTHARRAWLYFDESPPRAPTPATHEGAPPPEEYYAPCVPVTSGTSPALCGAIRFMRGLAAALEDLSELRLAVPRAALLQEHLAGGSCEAHPPNNGWPDTSVEVSASLFLSPTDETDGTGASFVEYRPHGGAAVRVPTTAGGILFTLARQVATDVPALPAGAAREGGPRRWISMPIYSCWLRGHGNDRLLGMSQEQMAETRESLAPIMQHKDAFQLAKDALGA